MCNDVGTGKVISTRQQERTNERGHAPHKGMRLLALLQGSLAKQQTACSISKILLSELYGNLFEAPSVVSPS